MVLHIYMCRRIYIYISNQGFSSNVRVAWISIYLKNKLSKSYSKLKLKFKTINTVVNDQFGNPYDT